jgi:hypothetical protein
MGQKDSHSIRMRVRACWNLYGGRRNALGHRGCKLNPSLLIFSFLSKNKENPRLLKIPTIWSRTPEPERFMRSMVVLRLTTLEAALMVWWNNHRRNNNKKTILIWIAMLLILWNQIYSQINYRIFFLKWSNLYIEMCLDTFVCRSNLTKAMTINLEWREY